MFSAPEKSINEICTNLIIKIVLKYSMIFSYMYSELEILEKLSIRLGLNKIECYLLFVEPFY